MVNWCTHRCFSEGTNFCFSWCTAPALQPRFKLKELIVSLPHTLSVMVVLLNTSWVPYVTWYYERLEPFLSDSYPQAKYEVCVVLFPGWENCSVYQAFCTACMRQKATVTQEPVYSHIQEEKRVSLRSDSVFRAEGSEDQKHSAFLKNALTRHVVIVFFFFH